MSHSLDIMCAEPDRLELRLTSKLQAHPAIRRLGFASATVKRSVLADRGEEAFNDPLTVTNDGNILDGHARWELAKAQGRRELLCIIRTVAPEQALIHFLRAQHRSARLNDFNRIRLALELEPYLKVQAHLNQSTGGRTKLSSEVTKAQPLDVRTEIARIAGVSAGNVTHAKFLMEKAAPEVIFALAEGTIRIGRARGWLNSSRDGGQHELRQFQMKRTMRAASKALLSRHPSVGPMNQANGLDAISSLPHHQQQELLRHLLITLPESTVRQALVEAGVARGC